MNRPIHISARWAPIGLGAVLLALVGFAMWAALSTSAATGRATTAGNVSAAFSDARFAISQQGSLERKYRLEPSPEIRDRHAEAATELVDAMGSVHETGGDIDRDTAQWTFARQDEYRASVNRLFTAVDAGDIRAVALIGTRTDPIFESIEQTVNAAAMRSRAQAQAALTDLRATQELVVVGTPVAFSIGLFLLFLLTQILTSALRRSHQQTAENRRMALHDALTGLPNRVLFNDRLGQALRDAARDQTELAVLMIDLDRFKEVNDSLGHAAGDELLIEAAVRLQAAVRERDTIARMGGDEFAVLLPTTDVAGARRVAGSIEKTFEEPFLLTGLQVEVMASTGIACCPEHGNDAETLLQRADVAMYFAKGRHSGHAMYSDENDPYDPDQLALVGELRRAISDEELLLYYQPKLDLKTNQVTSVEALVRWQHPTRGLLPPVRFVPLAERTGMIRPLTLWVLERALGQCRAWMDAGQELVVGVNLSVQSLLDPEFVAGVTRLLERHGVPARLLEFEITESSVMDDPARSIVLLGRLRELGIGLSIDDFGTGYSSLAYLSQLPVGEIKIDKSFVMAMQTNHDDAVIVRSTIDLARNLGFTVVAEGVETEETLDALRALGCDAAQGYLLSRPVPSQELDQWLASQPINRHV